MLQKRCKFIINFSSASNFPNKFLLQKIFSLLFFQFQPTCHAIQLSIYQYFTVSFRRFLQSVKLCYF